MPTPMESPPDWFWNVLDSKRPSLAALEAWLVNTPKERLEQFASAYELAAHSLSDYWDGPLLTAFSTPKMTRKTSATGLSRKAANYGEESGAVTLTSDASLQLSPKATSTFCRYQLTNGRPKYMTQNTSATKIPR